MLRLLLEQGLQSIIDATTAIMAWWAANSLRHCDLVQYDALASSFVRVKQPANLLADYDHVEAISDLSWVR